MQTLSAFYESIFGCKTYKISLDAGCTCPNRDGTKGRGGCIFCSEAGSGDFIARGGESAFGSCLSISEQLEQGKKLVEAKLRGRSGERQGKYIAYFQSFTSTYGDAAELLAKYHEALGCEGVAGLAVATRPDCLGNEILRGLAEISQSHFVQIELGLQTSNEKTGQLINRCYTNEDYIDAVRRIREVAPEIHKVTHLIFGLPGESEEDMLNSVRFVVKTMDSQVKPGNDNDMSLPDMNDMSLPDMNDMPLPDMNDLSLPDLQDMSLPDLQDMSLPGLTNMPLPGMNDLSLPGMNDMPLTGLQDMSLPALTGQSFFGLKITSLYILKNTRLATLYESDEYEPLTKEQYFALLQKALPLLPEACVVHRLTGDPPKSQLLAPVWTTDKKRVLNDLLTLLKSHYIILLL